MGTMIILALVALISLVVHGYVTALAARWFRATHATFGRGLLVCSVVFALSFAITTATAFTMASDFTFFSSFGAAFLIEWFVAKVLFGTTSLRALFVLLAGQGIAVLLLLPALLGIRAYVFDFVVLPSNNMAPTMVGWHREGICSHCNGKTIIPAIDPTIPGKYRDLGESAGVCVTCWKKTELPDASGEVTGVERGDRIAVNKLFQPQRWDVVEIRYPPNPTMKYIDRLVGLPGEKIEIKEGSLWINDAKMEPPSPWTKLRFVPNPENQEPVQLGPDQYFVLGDYPERSNDSRYWGPVPASHMEGVVTFCYWPPNRWRVFK